MTRKEGEEEVVPMVKKIIGVNSSLSRPFVRLYHYQSIPTFRVGLPCTIDRYPKYRAGISLSLTSPYTHTQTHLHVFQAMEVLRFIETHTHTHTTDRAIGPKIKR